MTNKNILKTNVGARSVRDEPDCSETNLASLQNFEMSMVALSGAFQNLEKSLVAISEASEILADKFLDDDKAGVSLIDPAIVNIKDRAAKKIFKRLLATEFPKIAEVMEEVVAEVKEEL